MTTAAIIAELVRCPNLPALVLQLNEELEARERALDAFIEKVTPETKAEFINGEEIYHSPVRREHARASGNATTLLKLHQVHRVPAGEVFFDRVMIRLGLDAFEPDILYYGPEKARLLRPKQVIFPAPDWVAEILSSSTEDRDRGVKRERYAIHGIAEYWIVDTDAEAIEQYLLEGEVYRHAGTFASGEIEAVAIPGFRIPVRAIFDDEVCRETLARIVGGKP